MPRIVASLVALIAAACNRGAPPADRGAPQAPATAAAPAAPAPSPAQDAQLPPFAVAGGPSPDDDEFIRRCTSMLSAFGMRLAQSPRDDGLTSFVEQHMRRTKEPFPPSYKFVISAREGHHVVSAVNMIALCRAKQQVMPTYHVSETAGRFEVLYKEEAGGGRPRGP